MDREFVVFVNYVVIVILFIFFIKAFLRSLTLRKFYLKLQTAASITDQISNGDYIFFSGRLAMPQMILPVTKKRCGYWGATIRAVFQTKAKKPGKGMKTHQPVIYKEESEQLPLLLTSQNKAQNKLIHIAIDKPMRFMVNLKSKITESKQIPIDAAKEFDQAKYTSYKTSEYWLPEKANLQVWAMVTGNNNGCTTVSCANDVDTPTLIYHGDKNGIFKRFRFRLLILFVLMIYAPFAIFIIHRANFSFNSANYLFILDILMLMIGFGLYRIGRISFVK
ncbi:MAG: hypothetical protein HQL46_03120 [Gammaproteobacteria bacterium]|nr:hypothetical protein [Gammaproteobacteria bacterium]